MKIVGGTRSEIPIAEIRSKKLREEARAAHANGDDKLQRAESPSLFEQAIRKGRTGLPAATGAAITAAENFRLLPRWLESMFKTLGVEQHFFKAFTPQAMLKQWPRHYGLYAAVAAAALQALVSGKRNFEAVRKGNRASGEAIADVAKDTAVAGASGFAGIALGTATAIGLGVLTRSPRFSSFAGLAIGVAATSLFDRAAHRVLNSSQYHSDDR